MENGNQNAMGYFSSAEGKQAIQSIRESFANTADEIRNLSMPAFHFDTSEFQPHLPQNNLAGKFNELIRLNEQSNNTNKEISKLLSSAQLEISSLKSELSQIKETHKHDFLKSSIVAVIGAIIGVFFTVIAAKNGLLK